MAHRHLALEDYHQTLQTLLADIRQSLEAENIPASDEFIIMMIKLGAIDPGNKFLIRQQMVQSEVNRMKKVVMNRITSMTEISRNIIAMQIHFKINYLPREDAIEANRVEQDKAIRTLMDDMKTTIPRNLKHHDFWYAKLIGATIIEADMGPATEPSVVRETEAALTSIFPKEDINLLSTMTVRDREEEIRHLMHLAIGIRLFNKSKTTTTKYGAFIEDLPKLLPERIESYLEQMGALRDVQIKRLISYTTLIQPYFLRHVTFKLGRRVVTGEMIAMRQGLVLVHQILIYLKEMSDDLLREKIVLEQTAESYSFQMRDTHSAVNKKKQADVTNAELYTLYLSLCDSWKELQDTDAYITMVEELIGAVRQMSEGDLKGTDVLIGELLGNSVVPTQTEFFNFPNAKLPEDKFALAKHVDFREEFSPLQMSYFGFCIHSVVKGVGLIVLSNPQLGVFNWKTQNFLLSTPKAAMEFRRDPDSFIKKALAIARRWPELIGLLGIEKDVFNPAAISDADRSLKTTNILISSDVEAQTELHPIPSKIVPSYTWNEWELRRRGLMLSKIHKCRTHGTQTHWQALKENMESQTYSITSTQVQTDSNAYAEIPLNKFFIYGLRGLHCGVPPHVVDLVTDNPLDLNCMCATEQVVTINIEEDEIIYPPAI